MNKTFTNLLKNKNIKRSSRKKPVGAVFSESFNWTSRDLRKKPVTEKSDSIYMYYPKITIHYKNRKKPSTKRTPLQASLRKKEVYNYQNFLDKTNKLYTKFKVGDFLRTADFEKVFSKSDTTN